MLGRLFGGAERRALSYQAVWGAGGDLVSGTSLAGVSINQDNALRINAVYACVRIYVDTISTLPADTFIRFDGQRRPFRPRPLWVDEPDVGLSRADFLAQVLVSLFLDGNAFVLVIRGAGGDVVALNVLDPKRTEVRRNAARQIEYVYDRDMVLTADEVLHITEMRKPGHLRGVSRIDELRDTLGLAKALEDFASRFFGQGSATSGVIEAPALMTPEQAAEMRDAFEASHRGLSKAHRTGVLGGGAKFVKTGVDPEQAQMLQSRQQAVEDVCRAFRVSPSLLGVTTPGAMSYASVEQNAIQWVRFSVVPIVARIESALSRLLPSTAFLKFNLDSLLRGDTATRFAAYSQALQAGWMTINEVRRLEDERPIDGGDIARVPLANVDLAAANLVEMDRRTMMASRLILAGFDPAATLAALGLPAITHTGVPSTQLQPVAAINPDDPGSVYA